MGGGGNKEILKHIDRPAYVPSKPPMLAQKFMTIGKSVCL